MAAPLPVSDFSRSKIFCYFMELVLSFWYCNSIITTLSFSTVILQMIFIWEAYARV